MSEKTSGLEIAKRRQSFILPTYRQDDDWSCLSEKKIVVVIHLHYRESLVKYIEKIENIPDEITVCVFSSNETLLNDLSEKISRRNIFFLKKENRGRDVSTLLVAARDHILQSDYFCFLHDKQENYAYLKNDVADWVDGFWDNLLSNASYIYRLINVFESHSELGLLVSPEPSGEYTDFWAKGTWYKDFDNTKQLGIRLNLNVNMSEDIQVPGCGTVFWARTEALKKLVSYEWSYEDFPEEPMPFWGTLGHAVERILPFVAEDAGFQTGIVMTNDYISKKYAIYQYYAQEMFSLLNERSGFDDIHQIITIREREKKISDFIRSSSGCYIFGCGDYGKRLLDTIERLDLKDSVRGFIVSDGHRTDSSIYGYPVYELSEIEDRRNVHVIIGVHYKSQDQIANILDEAGIVNRIYGF